MALFSQIMRKFDKCFRGIQEKSLSKKVAAQKDLNLNPTKTSLADEEDAMAKQATAELATGQYAEFQIQATDEDFAQVILYLFVL